MRGNLDAAANNLAARETLVPSASAGPGKAKTILELRGQDHAARSLSVVIAPVIPEPSRGPLVHPCIAVIGWGTGGASTRAEVDFARGTHLQLAGSFVSIAGRNDGRVDDGSGQPIDPDPGPQDVVAMIAGAGSRAAFGRATRTFYFGRVGPGNARLAPVSPFAKTVLVTRFPVDTAIEVTFFDNLIFTVQDPGGNVVVESAGPRDQYTFAAGVPAPRLELYERAGAVQVQNTGDNTIAALQVIYELAL